MNNTKYETEDKYLEDVIYKLFGKGVDYKKIFIDAEKHRLTPTGFLKKLNSFNYNCKNKNKNLNKIEYKTLPMFTPIMSYMLAVNKVMNQAEFIHKYLEIYSSNKNIIEIRNDKELLNALKSRLSRAYISLVREYYIYLLLLHDDRFIDVTFNVVDDINGLDVTFEYKDAIYGVMIYQKTHNSDRFLRGKRQKVHSLDVDMVIELPINVFGGGAKKLTIVGKGKQKIRLPKHKILDLIIFKINKLRVHEMDGCGGLIINKLAYADVY